jgi:glycosyltransferase involved in cell wall biosynthesis
MNIHLENVNLNSRSGPNSFAKKLVKYMPVHGCSFNYNIPADVNLCFIESNKTKYKNKMFLRLDGIYFNTTQDYNKLNKNIKRTYELSDGVIFQSDFNKNLIFKYFGEHSNFKVIRNGADVATIKDTPLLNFQRYENLWCCAASWRPHKRLNENIRYFLQFSGQNDGLFVAGDVPREEMVFHERIHYVGNLSHKQLISLYKRSNFLIHLAWLDHCPNVVIDARACGCKIICSTSGGTKEIAGLDAILIEEEEWNYSPLNLYSPPSLDFSKTKKNIFNSSVSMDVVSMEYYDFFKQ